MKKRIITLGSVLALACSVCLGLAACSAQAQEKVATTPDKILVVYYSWSGNTRTAAQAVAETTGGTLAEISVTVPYPANYQACVDQAKKEIKENYRPAISVQPKINVADYDVILVGSPNWWSTIAPPVATFLASSDLKGKNVALFATHGGGGMARCEKDATRLSKGAKILKGAAFPGSGIGDSKEDIRQWVDSILTISK